ncbi:MAG: hypothetical protein ACREOE_04305, partial [Gemmatimonadales bacterium]
AVQVLAGPVIPHRRAGISVAGGDLHVAQVSTSVDTGSQQRSNGVEWLLVMLVPGGYSSVFVVAGEGE